MSLPYKHKYQQYPQYLGQQTESQGLEPNTNVRLIQPASFQPIQSQILSIIPNHGGFGGIVYPINDLDANQTQYQGNHRSNTSTGNVFDTEGSVPFLPTVGGSIDQNMQFLYQNHVGHNSYPNILDYSSFGGNPIIMAQQSSQQYPYDLVQSSQLFQKLPIQLTKSYDSFDLSKSPNLKFPPQYQQVNSEDSEIPSSKVKMESPVFSSTFNESPETNASKTTSKGHFKPTQTKRNARPRINKLNRSEPLLLRINTKKPRLSNTANLMAELSTDVLFRHFQDTLKIEKPDGSQKASFYLRMKNELERQLFDLFVNHLSKSIDIFFPQEVFRKIIPELALNDETNMIVCSIFCLSSLMLQRINPDKFDLSITVRYYHQTITSIRHYLSIPEIEEKDNGIMARCLLSTILLCIYELFFVAIDSTYIKGASSILSSILMKNSGNKSLLKDSPFYQTCFWPMLLCDLIFSLKYNSPSMYSIESFWKPLDPEYFELYGDFSTYGSSKTENDAELVKLTTTKVNTTWWIHKSMIDFSSITKFKNDINVLTKEDFESNKPYLEWLDLKKNLDTFEKQMPLTIKPTIYKSCSPHRLFPIIYFKDEATAIIGLNYKLAKIMLYEALIQKTNLSDPLAHAEYLKYPKHYAVKLAKDIIGIIKTYDANLSVWTVNAHALRYVAHYVQHEPEASKGLEELVERLMEICHLCL